MIFIRQRRTCHSTAEIIARHLAAEVGLESILPDAPKCMEVTVRENNATRFVFMLNHSRETLSVPIPFTGTNLINQMSVAERIELLPYDVAIITQHKH